MSTLTKLMSTLMLLVTWVGMVSLQAAEPEVLTLAQAVDMAMNGNPDLQLARNQVKLAGISLKKQKSSLLPELALTANSNRHNAESQDLASGTSTNFSFSLNANLNLFNGFYDRAAIHASTQEELALQKELSRSAQTVLFNTVQGYFSAVLAREFIAVEEENLKAQQLQLQRIDNFFRAGRRPQADLFQQQAEIARSELRLLDAQRNDQLRKLQLMLSLGQSPRTDFQVRNPGLERWVETMQAGGPHRPIGAALAPRPDLQARELQVQASRNNIKAAAAGYWPKVSLYSSLGGDYSSLRGTSSFSSQLFDHNLNASVGLSLAIPLFDRWQTRNSVASATVQYNNRQVELEKTERQVSLDIQQAQAEFLTAGKKVQVSDSQVTYSRQALEGIEARYQVNAATMSELIQARAQMLEARYSWLEARFNFAIRYVALAYSSGDGPSMTTILHSLQGENK